VTAVLRLGAGHYRIGDYQKALAYLRQGVALTAGDKLRERFGMAGIGSVLGRVWLALTLVELGEFLEAREVAREGLDINLATDNLASRPAAYWAVGYVHVHCGEFAEALVPLTRAVEVARAAEVLSWESSSVGLLGRQRALTGQLAEGVALLERATSLAEQRD
jgi:tetratricopeptide (TPR) repeat protein